MKYKKIKLTQAKRRAILDNMRPVFDNGLSQKHWRNHVYSVAQKLAAHKDNPGAVVFNLTTKQVSTCQCFVKNLILVI